MVQTSVNGQPVRDYVNLTEGLAWVGRDPGPIRPVVYCRIQSTALEQKRWEQVLRSFPGDAYFHLALNGAVRVWDCSAHHKVSRALWQGLPWIYFCIQTIWSGYALERVWVRGHNVAKYFSKVLHDEVSTSAWREIKYFQRYWMGTDIALYGVSCRVGGPYEPNIVHPECREVFRFMDFSS